VTASQIRAVLSPLAVASQEPSGATANTQAEGPTAVSGNRASHLH
jgi:hypothetical protein